MSSNFGHSRGQPQTPYNPFHPVHTPILHAAMEAKNQVDSSPIVNPRSILDGKPITQDEIRYGRRQPPVFYENFYRENHIKVRMDNMSNTVRSQTPGQPLPDHHFWPKHAKDEHERDVQASLDRIRNKNGFRGGQGFSGGRRGVPERRVHFNDEVTLHEFGSTYSSSSSIGSGPATPWTPPHSSSGYVDSAQAIRLRQAAARDIEFNEELRNGPRASDEEVEEFGRKLKAEEEARRDEWYRNNRPVDKSVEAWFRTIAAIFWYLISTFVISPVVIASIIIFAAVYRSWIMVNETFRGKKLKTGSESKAKIGDSHLPQGSPISKGKRVHLPSPDSSSDDEELDSDDDFDSQIFVINGKIIDVNKIKVPKHDKQAESVTRGLSATAPRQQASNQNEALKEQKMSSAGAHRKDNQEPDAQPSRKSTGSGSGLPHSSYHEYQIRQRQQARPQPTQAGSRVHQIRAESGASPSPPGRPQRRAHITPRSFGS